MSCSLYIHIPYCRSRCIYCDFHSSSSGVQEDYVEALCRAIPYEREFETVYIGGGTPSLLSAQQLNKLCGPLKVKGEFTLEGNPDSLDYELLSAALSLGVNRLSIGIQSTNDTALRMIGRRHTAKKSQQAIEVAKKSGFDNISLDLMVGIPHQSESDIVNFAVLADRYSIPHISCYMLKTEQGTPLFNMVQNGTIILPSEDDTAEQFDLAVGELKKVGLKRYEISNFAKDGSHSRHNMRYWDCCDYLGVGASAHSCLDGIRSYYEADTQGFIDGSHRIEDGVCDAEDFIMLQTRLSQGLSVARLKRRFSYTFNERQLTAINRLQTEQLLTFDGEQMRLTDRGLMLQNSILTEIL